MNHLALSWSALASLYMLMVGYVYQDTGRRGMQARLWIVVCLVLPGGIGAVLYFLLRQPLISLCPACGTRVQSEYHYCPQCAFQITASCGRCFRSARPNDQFSIARVSSVAQTKGRFILLNNTSGAGKTTLAKELRVRLEPHFPLLQL